MLLQSNSDPFVIRNKYATLFEMFYHRTCNIKFTCSRYMICGRSNYNIVTISTLLFYNIWLSRVLNVCRIIINYPTITIIVSFIFYFVNTNRSCHLFIVILTPYSIIIRVCNIMPIIGTLWKMYNKHKEFILLVIQDKLERYLNEIIPFFCSDPIICKSIELNQ